MLAVGGKSENKSWLIILAGGQSEVGKLMMIILAGKEITSIDVEN